MKVTFHMLGKLSDGFAEIVQAPMIWSVVPRVVISHVTRSACQVTQLDRSDCIQKEEKERRGDKRAMHSIRKE